MSSRRTIILIGAILVGCLAAFLTLNYVRGVEQASNEENQLVEVLVAIGPIPQGTSADEALAVQRIGLAKRRQADLPVGAIRRDAEIEGMSAVMALSGGEIITSNMFVAPQDLTGTKATQLDKGNVAVTIQVDETSGVAGLIQPGDLVNVFVGTSDTSSGEPGTDAATAPTSGRTLANPHAALFQNAKVLGVGQSLGVPVAAKDENGNPIESAPVGNTGLITLQLPPEQALLLASMRSAGLYLTLNRPDYEPVPLPLIESMEVLPGETILPLYPETDAAKSNGEG